MAAPGGDRRLSTTSSSIDPDRPRSPPSAAESNENVFDDEFASEYAPSIVAPSENFENPFRDPASSSSDVNGNPFNAPDEPYEILQPRNSIRKSQANRQLSSSSMVNSPALVNSQFGHGERRVSVTSSASYAAPQSPTASEHIPSHPYGMYPQVGVSRTTSLSSPTAQRASIIRPSRDQRGPTHPYSLYPQDISTSSEITPPPPIHVGFPGHGQHFHRRIGPEGEEQDIVGIDGHLEQLPPYSRFPVAVPKPVTEPSPLSAEVSPSRSGETLPEMQERYSTRDGSMHRLNDSTDDSMPLSGRGSSPVPTSSGQPLNEKPLSEKSWSEKTWREKGKTKVLGFVRLWVLLLVFTVIAFIVIFCGTFVSVYIRKQTKDIASDVTSEQSHIPTTITYIDAAPTATPTDISPIPTGTFVVPLGPADQVFGECLNDDQEEAWTCELPGQQTLCVTIKQGLDGRAFLSTCNNGAQLEYGSQPPFITQQTLRIVADLDNTTLGAAWHFQTFYDKLAILPQSYLAQPVGSKRDVVRTWDWLTQPSKLSKRTSKTPMGAISVGEEAWFCHWDDTFIEGFIYASVSNPGPPPPSTYSYEMFGTSTTAPAAETTTTTTSPPPPKTITTGGSYRRDAKAQDVAIVEYGDYGYGYGYGIESYENFNFAGKYATSVDDDDYLYTTDSTNSASASTVLPIGAAIVASTEPTTSSSSSSSSSSASMTATSSESTYTPMPTAIPKLVKLEERRLKGLHDVAVCSLMRKMEDMTFTAVNDSNENAITVSLVEDDGPNGINNKLRRIPMVNTGGGAALERRQNPYVPSAIDQTCYCQWTSEQFE